MIKQAKNQASRATAAVSVADVGSWAAAALGPCQKLSLDWTGPGRAEFGHLPGWKGPLWRLEEGALEILRPEGRWRTELPAGQSDFMIFQKGADGWLSRRGIAVGTDSMAGVWFDQQGIAQLPEFLDQEAKPPEELADLAHASGSWGRWELTPEGKALGWLDDSFESGPFSVRNRNPYLVVSNGDRKVAYWMGASHWAWPMLERGMLLLRSGRGGGWEPERVYSPVLI